MILCLDFDGVCSKYSGWKGADNIDDEPMDGLVEFLEEARKHFSIHIYSSRSNQDGGLEAMKNWFKNIYGYLPEWLVFDTVKPPAFVSLDDRTLTFNGVFPDIKTLIDFKPWWK